MPSKGWLIARTWAEHDDRDRWRCRTSQGGMRSLGDAAEEEERLTNAGHRTPGGREARQTRHSSLGVVIGRCPQSARDEPSVEHVLLGQTTCVSRFH